MKINIEKVSETIQCDPKAAVPKYLKNAECKHKPNEKRVRERKRKKKP